MNEAWQERVQDGVGEPGFVDAVEVHVWLPEQASFAGMRIERDPAKQTSCALAFVLTDGARVAQATTEAAPIVEHWGDAHVGPVALGTLESLGRWTAELRTDEATLACELEAVGPPVDVLHHVPGLTRYTQLATVEGRVTTGGKETRVRGQAVRTHAWGPRTEARRRFVTAATAEGTLVGVAADRARAANAHGDELVGGEILDARDWAGPFEEVRLSTVYGADGLPRKAGLELYRPGDELPARLSGQAAGGATFELGGTELTVAFFDWRLSGRPAWGTYELESAA